MDALREGVYLRGYAQKDPLIEYKTEAYDMFVELMANIKNEVLNNLFRSTSKLAGVREFPGHVAAILDARTCADRTNCERRRAHASARWGDGRSRREMATLRAGKYRSTFRFVVQYRRSAATNHAPAAAEKNTRTAAAAWRK